MNNYDCTNDTLDHRARVAFWLEWLTDILPDRALRHDESKLHPPEKEFFDNYIPLLKESKFGSIEYEDARLKLAEGLEHHYRKNPHHPEHFSNGISGMTIWDLTEMIADWMASASTKPESMNLSYLQERFNIDDQLMSIIRNTLFQADMSMINYEIPLGFAQRMNFLSGEEQCIVR